MSSCRPQKSNKNCPTGERKLFRAPLKKFSKKFLRNGGGGAINSAESVRDVLWNGKVALPCPVRDWQPILEP
jgi:hypothetical protein